MFHKRIILSDFYRSLASPRFWLTILGIILVCFINGWEYLKISLNNNIIDITYVFNTMMAIGSFKNMLILFGSLPFVSSFCGDWNTQYLRPLVIRCGVRRYSWSKVIVSSVSTFLSISIGLILFIVILSVKLPFFIKTDNLSQSIALIKPYGTLLFGDFPIFYFLAFIFLISIASAFWTTLGLYISSYIPNRFVAISSPFISSYILSSLTEHLPIWLNLRCLTYGYDIINKGPGITLIYTLIVFIGLIVILGFIFERNVKRRLGNELI